MGALADCPWQPIGDSAAFWLGFFGAGAVSLLRLGKLYKQDPIDRPATVSDPLFWVHYGAPVPIGGGFTMIVAWELPCITETMAFLLGILAPTLIQSMLDVYGLVWGEESPTGVE